MYGRPDRYWQYSAGCSALMTTVPMTTVLMAAASLT